MRIFAMSISAEYYGGIVHTVMDTKSAASTEEAIGIGIEHAKKRWSAPGYYDFRCEAIEIPQEWIKEANDGKRIS